ncbi:hypothetical protein CFC21_059266 [Triticum aestivum]|uniref:Zinc finger GRF-type domain-containing protein n=2 Tax=Triticum aestivum TaxID=4565 RepID=A0A9R1KEC2_WHEAT|nr:hypothetical protein CFC21_059266 [Triticum aestivum]
MASSGSMTRPSCADREDMQNKWENAKLDEVTEKDMKTPSCWCGDVCKVKVSTDRKKSWTEGRRFFVCPNYAHDRRLPINAYDVPPVWSKSNLKFCPTSTHNPNNKKIYPMQSPPPLCKYFTWMIKMFQRMSKRTNIKIVLRGNGGLKKHFRGAWMKSVVRRRRWNKRNARRRGHAKRRMLVQKRGQESLQGLVMHKRRMRHVTRRAKGPCFLSDL